MSDTASRLVAPPEAADAAAFWLIKRDRGVALENDPGFAAWRAASQANADAWRRATAAWDGLEAGDDPLLEAMRRDALSARPPSAGYAPWAAAAACAAIVIALAAVGWRSFVNAPTSNVQLVAANTPPTFVTAVGAPSTLSLPDGSQVTLDTDSALAVAYAGDHRAVRLLRGQASFSVLHDPGRPFTVDVGARTVTDLGTEFVVRLDGPSLRVTLVKGRVTVSSAPGAPPRTLAPGQELDAAPGRDDQIVAVDLTRSLAWRTGYLEFEGEPLDRAIAEMNRYGGAPAVADASLERLPVSGRFRVGNPVRFAQALSELYPLRLTRRHDGGVEITRR